MKFYLIIRRLRLLTAAGEKSPYEVVWFGEGECEARKQFLLRYRAGSVYHWYFIGIDRNWHTWPLLISGVDELRRNIEGMDVKDDLVPFLGYIYQQLHLLLDDYYPEDQVFNLSHRPSNN